MIEGTGTNRNMAVDTKTLDPSALAHLAGLLENHHTPARSEKILKISPSRGRFPQVPALPADQRVRPGNRILRQFTQERTAHE
jgi:hypothetical protein